MAKKNKVPIVAIRLIIQMRQDEYHNHSYKAIAEHIKDKFGIQVTPQAIGYLYKKYKDNYTDQNIQENKEIESVKKPVFKPKEISKDILQGFNKEADNIDLDDLFKPAD